MNIVSVIDLPEYLRDDYSRELLSISENLIRTIRHDEIETVISMQKLSVMAIDVKPYVVVNVRNATASHGMLMLLKLQLGKGEMFIEYVNKLKQGKMYWHFDHVPLTIPGSVERIQDIIYKSIKVYSKWVHSHSKPAPKPKSKTKIAHRRT